jgi:hypothetical protein
MSNTIIQIKRSTATVVPASLEAGELAFTSNGDSLWIGSPSGSNTANVVHVGSKISYIGNSSQIGASAGGSNTELASTYAIKQFVDGKLGAYSTALSGLTDVALSTPANNNFLVYDAAAARWENHTVSGTANQIDATYTGQNLVLSLPAVVNAQNITLSSNLVVSGTANVTGEAHFFNVVHINRDTPAHVVHYISNPTLIATVNVNSFGQVAMQNFNGGANSSADIIAYPNNTQVDDNTGFIDMGITGNGFNQAAYSVTGPNDGYIFQSARSGDSLGGSLVFATDSTGVNNDIKFFVGGFTYNANSPHMVLASNTRSLGINNANPTSRLSVGGSAWINGTTQSQDIVPLANVTYSIGNTTNRYLSVFANTVTGTNANFTSIAGALITANQPNITNVGTLATLTVTGAATFNGNMSLGNATGDIISITGSVNTHVVPDANLTYDIGSATKQWRDVYAGNGYFTNITATGNLTILGTLTTIDTENIVIEDPMIRLAKNQANTGTFTDAVDIGFYGVYGNTSQIVYTGLARDSSTNTFVLFDGLNQAPDNVVNTAAITVASLTTYLQSGGLVTNSSAVAITANSTLSVAITANTLSLSTALGVASGGSGRSTFTNNYVIVGNTTGPVTMIGSSTEGHVLQISSSGAPAFGGLDGGTF